MYQYPASELDSAQALLGLLGSLWSETYQGNFLLESLLYARGRIEQQVQNDFEALLGSVSRFRISPVHFIDWYPLQILESQLDQAEAELSHFDDGVTVYDQGAAYDTPLPDTFFVWAAPAGLADAPIIHDGITKATLAWVRGVDYELHDEAIWFLKNPFDSGFLIQEIFQDGALVDRQATVWIYRSSWNRDDIYRQFGYAVDLQVPSSRTGKNLVNAVYDAITQGTSARAIEEALGAITDVPLAIADDVVQAIEADTRNLWVIGAKNAYRFSPNSQILVSVGDACVAGQALADGLQLFRFNRGQLPDAIRALSVSRGMLAAGFFQDLTFENKSVPLVVEEDVYGYTKVSFEIGGFPGDVDKFWDIVHREGIRKNQTLAMLLDQRPATSRTAQPTALGLPATVNPLGFLVQNLFRDNLFVALVKPAKCGPDALGLPFARVLRKVIPPGTACIVLVQLEMTGDKITMDGPGTPERAGVDEIMSFYLGTTFSDTITPDLITEKMTFRAIGGRCE